MKHSHRLAIAGGLAAAVLPGTLVLLAPSAAAGPDSGLGDPGSTTSEVQLRRTAPNEQGSKALNERQEQLQQQQQPASSTSSSESTSDGFPWAIAGLSALGIAAVAAGGVAVSRHSRHVPQSA